MQAWLTRTFHLRRLGTTVGREVIGGVTTFVTMAYIIIVNPKILEAAGIPFGPSMVATILTAAFGTMAMGIYANRPFAIAPYMGENAFLAYTVVKVMGYSWQTALGAVFLAGLLFTILTLVRVRTWLADAIPESLKLGFTVGIGLFLTFIGLNETGFVVQGAPGAPVHVGDLRQPGVLLGIGGFILAGLMMIRRWPVALLGSILAVSAAAFLLGMAPMPDGLFSMPPGIGEITLQLDVAGALTWGVLGVVLTVFVMGFVDTLGTLIGLGYKAGLMDEHGNLPEIEKPMLVDAVTTSVGALLGTSTSGAYVESAAGIAAGGRSGLTAVVTALLFLLALFFAPLCSSIPPFAYGPALVLVGCLMVASVSRLRLSDLAETIPVFAVIVLMSFTYNVGIGMTAGFILHPLFMTLTGRVGTVKPGMWVLAALSALFFVFYPY